MTREAELIGGRAMLTAAQVADVIGMSEVWVRKAGRVGIDLPRPVRVSARMVRWRAVDIQRWIEARGEAKP